MQIIWPLTERQGHDVQIIRSKGCLISLTDSNPALFS